MRRKGDGMIEKVLKTVVY